MVDPRDSMMLELDDRTVVVPFAGRPAGDFVEWHCFEDPFAASRREDEPPRVEDPPIRDEGMVAPPCDDPLIRFER